MTPCIRLPPCLRTASSATTHRTACLGRPRRGARRSWLLPLLLLLPVVLVSCSREPDGGAPASGSDAADGAAEDFRGRVFERNIVFLTLRSDSILLVPWLTSARTAPSGVRREARGLLARGDSWEPFFDDEWDTAATRLPWRILPRGRMRIVVGQNDALEQIVFDEGPRQLDVILSQPLVEWSGPRGETIRLLDGALVLSSARVPGLILDLTRGRSIGDPPGGDWGIVVAGEDVQVVLHAAEAGAPGTPGAYRAWARMGAGEIQWPEVTVVWNETRAFERARREFPVAWTVTADSGDMRADLTVRTAHVQAGAGEGPQLPLDALLEVEGTLRIGSVVHPVRGLLRHTQP